MEIYYWKANPPNFGDELNPWLWPKLIPGLFQDQTLKKETRNDEELFVGIGTILNNKLPKDKKKIVFGSGVGYGVAPIIDNNFKIYFVRGPLSAKALNLDTTKFITDPAILIKQFQNDIKNKIEIKYNLSFVPHYSAYEYGDWEKVCQNIGIHCISPYKKVEEVALEINSSEFIVADSMHGAILADTFRVPWCVVHPKYGHILDFKWNDWANSMELKYCPDYVSPIWRGDSHRPFETRIKNKVKRSLKNIGIWNEAWGKPDPKKSRQVVFESVCEELHLCIERMEPTLSKDAIFDRKYERCMEMLDLLRHDYA